MSDSDLARFLGGDVMAPGLIGFERRIPCGANHGDVQVPSAFEGDWLARLDSALPACSGPVVFLDTETTGLAGGAGTVAFLLGLARLARGHLHVTQYLLTGFSGEPAMLADAARRLAQASTLVSFNGKCFDLPLLDARFRLAGMANPCRRAAHVDLLYPVRRAFAATWPNCRLVTVEERLLAFCRRDDVPGWEVPRIWYDWLRHGSHVRLGAVVQHNRWDVITLAALVPALQSCFDDPVAWGADPLCAWHVQDEAGVYSYLFRRRCDLGIRSGLELARLARRRGEWKLAVELWTDLAAAGQVQAIESLAKYHEHVGRDLVAALEWTERLVAHSPRSPRHGRRRERLLLKMQRRFGP